MTTAWWLVVLALIASGSFLGGYLLRAEFELYHRAYEIDLTRKQVGA